MGKFLEDYLPYGKFNDTCKRSLYRNRLLLEDRQPGYDEDFGRGRKVKLWIQFGDGLDILPMRNSYTWNCFADYF